MATPVRSTRSTGSLNLDTGPENCSSVTSQGLGLGHRSRAKKSIPALEIEAAGLTENESSFVENIPHTPLNRLAPYPTWFIFLPLEGRAYSVLGWRIWLHRPPKRGAYSQPHTYLLVTVVLDTGLLVSSTTSFFTLSIQYHLLASSFSLNDRAT